MMRGDKLAGVEVTRRLQFAATVVLALLVAGWLWRSICVFPALSWNEIRLAPAVQVWHGSPYADLGSGPTTTWIYGPLPLLMMSPIVAAGCAPGAMLLGACLNLLIVVTPIVATVLLWPVAVGWSTRIAVALAAVAIWAGGDYRFFTPDNAAVAWGITSILLLARSRRPETSLAAAGACAAAMLCKQTLIGLAAAEILWMWLQGGGAAAARYAIRVAALAVVGYAIAAWVWGGDALAFSLLVLPGRQPWTSDWIERAREYWPELLFKAAAPGAVVVYGWRRFRAEPRWLLLALVWICSLPLDLASFFKHGGAANSLHAGLLVIPAALAFAAVWIRRPVAVVGLTGMAAAITAAQLLLVAPAVWKPQVQHLRQGDAIARAHPGEVYFPWHPLVSWYAEGRIDEVEDGLFIRASAGLPVRRAEAHLPPRLHQIAFLWYEGNWGIARRLAPADARVTTVGMWDIVAWPAPVAPARTHPK